MFSLVIVSVHCGLVLRAKNYGDRMNKIAIKVALNKIDHLHCIQTVFL